MLHVLNNGLSPVTISRSNFTRKTSCCFFPGKSRILPKRNLSVFCRSSSNEDNDQIEEPPESLFMKELRRRGIPPSSLLEELERCNYELDDDDDDRASYEQRERLMAMKSEGLKGLVLRVKCLLTLGGTLVLAFWPFLVTVAFFSALYIYFGPSFVHNASKMSVSTPQYVDPCALLEDERISQIAPPVN